MYSSSLVKMRELGSGSSTATELLEAEGERTGAEAERLRGDLVSTQSQLEQTQLELAWPGAARSLLRRLRNRRRKS